MKKLLLSFLILTVFIGYSQEYSYVDFGNSATVTAGNWNNLVVTTQNQEGLSLGLIDSNGNTTGATLTLSDSFDHINANGTTSPNGALPFPSSSTRDSFFGATDAGFNGNVNPTGGFTLSGLDPTKYYSFSIFSSRAGVSDNRETLYTVVGSTTASQALNPSNNTTDTADILNIQPNASGVITLTAQPGTNNNNSFGFYYLGALQLIKSDTPIGDTTPDPELTLTYPNGGHLWEVGKTVRVKWSSISVPDMLIEFSSDNGVTWSTIATAPGSLQYYDMIVPNEISTECLVRISGEGLADISENRFTVIENEGIAYRIVILGSSTAAGTGPSDGNNAWVPKYKTYLTEMDTRYEVINLALGGFATYNILPTGSTIPAGVNRTIDIERNITKALSLNPGGIIINMPSNDAASGYPVSDQIANYNLISAEAVSANVPMWVTTPQPRNFGSNTTNLNIQLQMIPETYNLFGNDYTVDFWTGFPVANNNGILPIYDSGDGIHMNDAAHQILYDRIIGKGIHTTVRDNALNIDEFEVATIKIFPNPIVQDCTIQFSEAVFGNVNITMTDMLGKKVYTTNQTIDNGSVRFERGNLESGLYVMSLSYNNKSIAKQIIIN